MVRPADGARPFLDAELYLVLAFHDVAAGTACLRRVLRIHGHERPSVHLCLAAQHVEERPPPCIGDGHREGMVLHEVPAPQLFRRDSIVVLDVLERQLVQEILALAAHLLLCLSDIEARLLVVPELPQLLAAHVVGRLHAHAFLGAGEALALGSASGS